MRRREFITGIAGAAAACPFMAGSHQSAMPVVGVVSGQSSDADARNSTAFHKGLKEAGLVEDQNVTVEYHWLAGQYGQLATLMADLVHRQVAVIATTANAPAALAAKAATSTIPIVFSVGQDPIELGLVASLARPSGNVTGINFFTMEVAAKQLRLLYDLVPKARRIAVLVNPANGPTAESTIREVQEAAPIIGLQIQIFNAATSQDIDATFATFTRQPPDALLVAPDALFSSRRVQFVTLTARDRIPAIYAQRDLVTAGGLMSYGTDLADAARQVGIYTGRILKGTKPADLPVLQSTKFDFAINVQAARTLGIKVPPDLLSIADEVIE